MTTLARVAEDAAREATTALHLVEDALEGRTPADVTLARAECHLALARAHLLHAAEMRARDGRP